MFCLKQKSYWDWIFPVPVANKMSVKVMWNLSDWLLLNLIWNICKSSFCIKMLIYHYQKKIN